MKQEHVVKMKFMWEDKVCSIITANFTRETVNVENVTDDIFLQAFGRLNPVTWSDFEKFLEERCIPRTRHKLKEVLLELGIQEWNPMLIIRKTQGRMAGDNHWLDLEDCYVRAEEQI